MAVFINVRNNQFNNNNNNIRRNRIFRDRLHPLDAYNDTEIIRRYRLSRGLILELYEDIGNRLEPATLRNHAVPGILQIFCALRFYSTGSFQSVVGDGIGIHKSTVSRIINRVTVEICRLKNRYIKFPRRQADIVSTKQSFHAIAEFPQVIGAIDGTLIAIKTPQEEEHRYVSRKGGHSLNILAICNADLQFTYVVAKYPGSTNDSFIWSNCNLHDKFENGDYGNSWLLGDSGYVCEMIIMKTLFIKLTLHTKRVHLTTRLK